MRQAEMTSEKIKERDEVFHSLLGAGWTSDEMNESFANGLWCHSEAIMHYQNSHGLDLQVEYYAEDESIYFSFFDDESDGMGLLFIFGESLTLFLEELIGFQDNLSLENYKTYIARLVRISVESYVQHDDELIPLDLD